MKHSIFLSLALAVLCGSTLASPRNVPFPQTADLGNVMFVGDSITHGVGAASYRWPLFKIWVDNAISLKEVGVHARNHSGGVQPNTPYGSATFLNVHSAISSERAYEIAGRINKSGRLENSNIFDWLGLDKDYNGKRRIDPATEMPAHFFMMIGTNDTLSDSGQEGIRSNIAEKEKNLLGRRGDLETIIDAMREGNPGANITLTTIPTWAPGRHKNNAPEDYEAIERYNEKLKDWGRANKVAVVEINKGMVDIPGTAKVPFVGLPGMFGRDKLHPSAQGDLIIAGNVAQQLGYAGRTAGLARKAASELPAQKKPFVLNPNSSYSQVAIHEGEAGTVEFRLAKGGYGNGATGGWDNDKPLDVRLDTSGTSGTLRLSEGYISWNGAVLYSADMSKLREPIRMSYVAGDTDSNIPGGYYVWLGDMLIGEALKGEARDAQGMSLKPMVCFFAPKGAPGVRFESISIDLEHSWAPASKRFSAGNPNFDDAAAPVADAPEEPNTVTVRSADDVARLSAGSGAISGGSDTTSPRKLVFDAAPVSATVLNIADFDEVHLTNGSAVVLSSLGGAKKLVVDGTSRLGLSPAEYEASVLNSGTIILPAGTTLSLCPEGTDENETGTYIINGGTLNANNVRMSNTIRQNSGSVTGISEETFRGKLEKK